jgi:hypothetical protein
MNCEHCGGETTALISLMVCHACLKSQADARLKLSVRLERDDSIPAFGAFVRCEPFDEKNAVVLINVEAVMSPELPTAEGGVQRMSRTDRKRLLIETLMHEFGHALEAHLKLPVNERAIEKACANWEALHAAMEDPACGPRPKLPEVGSASAGGLQ